MDSKREQAMVGLFVLVATGILVATVFSLTGAFRKGGNTYRTSMRFAGGLAPGAVVRYLGGPQIGRVEQMRVDPENPGRIEITFTADPDTPVKTDSVVKIVSLSALGDNYLEITAGSAGAPRAPNGSALKSRDYFGISDLSEVLSELSPDVKQLIEELKSRTLELKETIARVNDLINQQNRANVAASLDNVRGMLEENRPRVKSTLSNVEQASAKIAPLMDDFKKTVNEAEKAIQQIETVVGENREDVRASVAELRKTLASASEAVDQINRTLNYNAENLDEIIENMRHATENLKQFTDLIKSRPASLLRSSGPPDRKPGQSKQ
jgi:phospholipid/cholesterol/gamma-HCH transport system substrate-binding protein